MVELYFENISDEELDYDFDCVSLAKQVISYALKKFNCKEKAEVSLYIVSEAYIKEVNKENRGIDKVTDVLSFPNLEFDEPGDLSFTEDEASFYEYHDPESNNLILGDIIICKKRMEEQAISYEHGNKREFAFLVIHSILHLLGFDHIEEDDRVLMEDKQKEILDELDIKR